MAIILMSFDYKLMGQQTVYNPSYGQTYYSYVQPTYYGYTY